MVCNVFGIENANIAPTINADPDQPIRRQWTPRPKDKLLVQVEDTDVLYADPIPGFNGFNILTPDVIESDYYGDMSFVVTGDMHIHAIVNNPLKPLEEMSLAGETSYQFNGNGKFGYTYNRVTLGMIYQWKISSLELLNVIVDQGHVGHEEIAKQKNWVYCVAARLMGAVHNFHDRIPLGIVKKELLEHYLEPHTVVDKEVLEFLFNIIGCKSFQIVACMDFIRTKFAVGTRFNQDDDLFFAFGY